MKTIKILQFIFQKETGNVMIKHGFNICLEKYNFMVSMVTKDLTSIQLFENIYGKGF